LSPGSEDERRRGSKEKIREIEREIGYEIFQFFLNRMSGKDKDD
jgi:hypothetical protein